MDKVIYKLYHRFFSHESDYTHSHQCRKQTAIKIVSNVQLHECR